MISSSGRKAGADKRALRDDAYSHLLPRLIRQEFEPGSKLHDFALAEELGLSRTPVREALLRLQSEGMVHSDPDRGFFIPVLTVQEAEEVYPIIAELELLALQGFDLRLVDTSELRRLNRAMVASASGRATGQRSDADVAFHEALLAPCRNRRLLELIRRQKQVVQKYEVAYMRRIRLAQDSSRGHSGIIRAVEAADSDSALRALEAHWDASMHSLLQALRKQEL
jgi:DNA-binding GntR family transcriptional regulator